MKAAASDPEDRVSSIQPDDVARLLMLQRCGGRWPSGSVGAALAQFTLVKVFMRNSTATQLAETALQCAVFMRRAPIACCIRNMLDTLPKATEVELVDG